MAQEIFKWRQGEIRSAGTLAVDIGVEMAQGTVRRLRAAASVIAIPRAGGAAGAGPRPTAVMTPSSTTTCPLWYSVPAASTVATAQPSMTSPPAVIGPRSLAQHYSRIGMQVEATAGAEMFETRGAIDEGMRVRRDLSTRTAATTEER